MNMHQVVLAARWILMAAIICSNAAGEESGPADFQFPATGVRVTSAIIPVKA